MESIARTSLLLVIVLVVLSAYLRLDHSGIGCTPWPLCYGNIGTEAGETTNVYERLAEEARRPLAWATSLHRLVASVLGLLVLALNFLAFRQRKDRLLSLSLLFLTVFLAWLGIRSSGLRDPAVIMGNLLGGFAMLGLLGWLVVRKPAEEDHSALSVATIVATALLCLQIVFGGLTSANFAASACRTLPDCHGSWMPGPALSQAFDLSHPHVVGEDGFVLGGAERMAIHKLHRIFAVVTVLAVLLAGALAIREGRDLLIVGAVLIGLVMIDFAVGISAILTNIPIGIAVAHNWLAGLLLLLLLKLIAESRAAAGG